jgi:hypothetical protein
MSFTWDELDQMRPKGDWRIPLPPTCRKCSYILTGLPEDRCPECGTPFTWKEVRKRASRTWTLTLRLRHANQDATTGIVLGLAGWFVLGFVRLIGWYTAWKLTTLLAFLVAFLTIVLGSQVLNIRRVPKWARSYAGDPPPSLALGAAAVFLGASLLVGVFIIPW